MKKSHSSGLHVRGTEQYYEYYLYYLYLQVKKKVEN